MVPKLKAYILSALSFLIVIGCADEYTGIREASEEHPKLRLRTNDYGTFHLKVISSEAMKVAAQALSSYKGNSRGTLSLVDISLTSEDSHLLSRLAITRLRLIDCAIEDGSLTPFAKLKTLNEIFLNRCSFNEDSLACFSATESLKILEIFNSKRFTGRIFSRWKGVVGVQKLTLVQTSLDDAAVIAIPTALPNLNDIEIKPVNGELLTLNACLELAKIRSLKIVGLDGEVLKSRQQEFDFFTRYDDQYRVYHGEDIDTPFQMFFDFLHPEHLEQLKANSK